MKEREEEKESGGKGGKGMGEKTELSTKVAQCLSVHSIFPFLRSLPFLLPLSFLQVCLVSACVFCIPAIKLSCLILSEVWLIKPHNK